MQDAFSYLAREELERLRMPQLEERHHEVARALSEKMSLPELCLLFDALVVAIAGRKLAVDFFADAPKRADVVEQSPTYGAGDRDTSLYGYRPHQNTSTFMAAVGYLNDAVMSFAERRQRSLGEFFGDHAALEAMLYMGATVSAAFAARCAYGAWDQIVAHPLILTLAGMTLRDSFVHLGEQLAIVWQATSYALLGAGVIGGLPGGLFLAEYICMANRRTLIMTRLTNIFAGAPYFEARRFQRHARNVLADIVVNAIPLGTREAIWTMINSGDAVHGRFIIDTLTDDIKRTLEQNPIYSNLNMRETVNAHMAGGVVAAPLYIQRAVETPGFDIYLQEACERHNSGRMLTQRDKDTISVAAASRDQPRRRRSPARR
jgi:hypothetical protein